MLTVETTITISIPEEGVTLETLEGTVAQAVAKVGRDMVVAGCRAIEERVMAREGRQLRRDKQRPLDLLTRFGWVKLWRWYGREEATGEYRYLLDERLGLRSRQHASPWVVAQAVALATRLPYRQATQLLREMVGAFIDHRTVYTWVQQAGARVVAEEDEEQEAVFGQGKTCPVAQGGREIVVAEVDGTFLKAQREGVPDFEVRLGVLYSGKELQSATAKHQRHRLLERVRYGGVERAEVFGERLFVAGEAKLGISRAKNLLVVGDGADWIEALAGGERWKATYQLDWWHLTRAFHRTFPDRPGLVSQLKAALYHGQGQEIVRLVGLAHALGEADLERVSQLHRYVRANQHGFYGAWKLRERLSPQAKPVAVVGSGAIEKQQDLVIGRRFKGQGMRWTKRGANRLLKLRLQELERVA